jgi:hypothetical protein
MPNRLPALFAHVCACRVLLAVGEHGYTLVASSPCGTLLPDAGRFSVNRNVRSSASA